MNQDLQSNHEEQIDRPSSQDSSSATPLQTQAGAKEAPLDRPGHHGLDARDRRRESGIVVIVARNNLSLTKRAVASAFAQTIHCAVLVIDNASSDGTPHWLATKNVLRITHATQKSLSHCWNQGIKAAWMAGFNDCLVINNDAELRDDTYYWLRHRLGRDAQFVTAISVDTDPQFFVERPKDWEPAATEREHPDFSCFLISKKVTDRVGFFDPAYFPAYCEDSDYHVRMHRAGIRAVAIDLPFFHHHRGANTIKSASKHDRRIIEKGAAANRERFRLKYGCLPGTPEYEALFTAPARDL